MTPVETSAIAAAANRFARDRWTSITHTHSVPLGKGDLSDAFTAGAKLGARIALQRFGVLIGLIDTFAGLIRDWADDDTGGPHAD